MKILVCYQDNVNKAFHKTIRITIPKTWNQCLVTNLIKQYVDAYNRVFTNKLEIDDIHFAIYLVDNVANIPIPSDGIISNYIYDRMKVYVRHNNHLGTSKDIPTSITTHSTKSMTDDTNQNTIPAEPAISTETTTPITMDVKKNNEEDAVIKLDRKRNNVTKNNNIPQEVWEVVNDDDEDLGNKTTDATITAVDVIINNGKDDAITTAQDDVIINIDNDDIVATVPKIIYITAPEAAPEAAEAAGMIIEDPQNTPQQQQQHQEEEQVVITENNNVVVNIGNDEDIISSGCAATVSTYMSAPLIDHFCNILDWLGVPENLYQAVVKDLENELLTSPSQDHPEQIITHKLGSLLEASYVNAMTHHAIDQVPPPQTTSTAVAAKNNSTATPNTSSSQITTTTGRDAPSSLITALVTEEQKGSNTNNNIDYDSAGEEFEIVMNHSSKQQNNKTTSTKSSSKNKNPTVVMNRRKKGSRHNRHDEIVDEIQRCVSE